MKKKIFVQDLRPGMYVSELDRHWRETPFLFQGFEIESDEQIEQITRYCKHVFIDTEQSYLINPKHRPANNKPRPAAAPAVEEKRIVKLEKVLDRFTPGHRRPPRYQDVTTLEEELGHAREIVTETRETVYNIMGDVRLGRSINTTAAKKVVADMVDSVIRNPDALMCLNQLKDKDEYTALHSLRVCVLALAFGRHLDLSDVELNLLGIGALLHDIGKMKVPNEIINKPGKLTDEEFSLMKSHVPHGVEILEQTHGIPSIAIDVARYHHERFSGGGYAAGYKGEEIGLFGSVGAIVDCYDAITSDRSYHNGLSAHDALNKMYSWRGRDFQPILVEQFIQCMGIYPIGSVVELSNNSIGVVVSINRARRLRPKVALVLNSDKQPYTPSKVIDLMDPSLETGSTKLEIRKVLPPGEHGVIPTKYIPLGA
ncbi:MAG: HD-GYP domain-containing protein [Gammaproteobacteria bacterium]|nr:HD-GYP domain-containing protein [Gammaproteobacteria bacterium]MDH3371598.1 HD-GYP domain-containing protein [Gammaproteobacteria bacterium]MDH3406020.1 HD-GYP domain-containing protein [Gammaproteobacteria bacterium]MDH3562747.1 HD-GYP domain-containing protein [Gammaproteobacteria bacterium]MDH5486360.1 HD-GYP domain-containing protein [Gammaproteobacteria bacterium]